MIVQDGTEWVCNVCYERFGRVENAVFHDFKKHLTKKEASMMNLSPQEKLEILKRIGKMPKDKTK